MHHRRLGVSGLLVVVVLAVTACSAPAAVPTPPGAGIPANVMATTTPERTAPPMAPETTAAPASGDTQRPMGWSEESHGDDADPNYAAVFAGDAVNTLTMTITPDDWAAMQADMGEIFADLLPVREAVIAQGAGLSLDERTALANKLNADLAKERAAAGAHASPPAADLSDRSPMWVPATISFQGREWDHVGVRYKGVSSLKMPWMAGEIRLPFKFDFDEFEDDYPAIKNQRFFGFKELGLANNLHDPAAMRDILVYELLGDAGLPSLRAAPYEVVLDYGEGPVRLGLYTMVEVWDDTGVQSAFGNEDGNLYEAYGDGASFALGTDDQIEQSLEKKNNEKAADWSDVRALYDLLHDPRRTSDPAGWRADLEAIFDVDSFLGWLGVGAFVGDVDTYGVVEAVNFYIYHNPETGKLTWLSWDHNDTFQEQRRAWLTFDKANVTDAWPLIRYLLDDPLYRERYVKLLAENSATALAPDAVLARVRAHAAVIAPVATQDMRQEEYDAAVQAITDYVERSATNVEEFLTSQK